MWVGWRTCAVLQEKQTGDLKCWCRKPLDSELLVSTFYIISKDEHGKRHVCIAETVDRARPNRNIQNRYLQRVYSSMKPYWGAILLTFGISSINLLWYWKIDTRMVWNHAGIVIQQMIWAFPRRQSVDVAIAAPTEKEFLFAPLSDNHLLNCWRIVPTWCRVHRRPFRSTQH